MGCWGIEFWDVVWDIILLPSLSRFPFPIKKKRDDDAKKHHDTYGNRILLRVWNFCKWFHCWDGFVNREFHYLDMLYRMTIENYWGFEFLRFLLMSFCMAQNNSSAAKKCNGFIRRELHLFLEILYWLVIGYCWEFDTSTNNSV